MNIIATKLASSMTKRQGYLPIGEAMDQNLKSYTFCHCLKLKKDSLGFTKWVLYWEDTDFVVIFTVLTTLLSTGYIKATIISRELTDINTVGEYQGKGSFIEVFESNGKFYTKKNHNSLALSELDKRDFSSNGITKEKENLSTVQAKAKIDLIADAWGIKPKKK